MKKRVLSGIRTSGNIHLGIYLAVFSQWLERQSDEQYENWFFVADLHGITTPYDPKKLQKLTMEAIMLYLACGLDPEQSTIFIQSHIPAHCELQWLLSCNTPMGWMNQMIQFKEKSKKLGDESVSVGLYNYPILMASDILLYQTDLVPVGEDQSQHVEIAREIGRRFNRLYGQVFKEPDLLLLKEGAKIMGLDNPEEKMSKSATSKYNFINLLDDPDEIKTKIAKAVTDDQKTIVFDPKRKAINNLLTIYQLLTKESKQAVEERFVGASYSDFKTDLTEKIIDLLSPIQKKYRELEQNQDYVMELMAKGAAKASAVANLTLEKAKKNTGLILPVKPSTIKEKPSVSFEDWQKLHLQIGKIKDAQIVPEANKLYKLTIDFGQAGETTIVAGIKEYFQPEELIGRQVPILRNLEAKNIRGIESKGMLLAADDEGQPVLLSPIKEVADGSSIR